MFLSRTRLAKCLGESLRERKDNAMRCDESRWNLISRESLVEGVRSTSPCAARIRDYDTRSRQHLRPCRRDPQAALSISMLINSSILRAFINNSNLIFIRSIPKKSLATIDKNASRKTATTRPTSCDYIMWVSGVNAAWREARPVFWLVT